MLPNDRIKRAVLGISDEVKERAIKAGRVCATKDGRCFGMTPYVERLIIQDTKRKMRKRGNQL